MQSLITAVRHRDVETPRFDLPDIDLSKLEMPTFDLPKVDLPNADLPKVDVAKAVADAAVAVGLSKPSRPRWQYALGAAVVVAAAGFVAMNAAPIRDRLSIARRWFADRARDMREGDLDHEPVAFTAADTKPIEESPYDPLADSVPAEYPDGLGAKTGSVTANGRSTVANSR